MKRSRLLGPWRLTARLIAREPAQIVLVGTLCTVAALAGIVSHAWAIRENVLLEEQASHRYGTVSVVIPLPAQESDGGDAGTPAGGEPSAPDDAAAIAARYPLLGRRSAAQETDVPGPDSWFSRAMLREVEQLGAQLGLEPWARIEAAVRSEAGTVRQIVGIDPGDPAHRVLGDKITPGIAGAAETAGAAGETRRTVAARPAAAAEPREHRLAVKRAPDAPVSWLTVPPVATLGTSADGTLWVRRRWLLERTVGTGDAVANVVVMSTGRTNPFPLAYELEERLTRSYRGVRVRSWPELAGRDRYLGSGSGASLLRPLVLLVAMVGIAGAAAVATRNRSRDIVVLRTLGMSTGAVRGVYVREALAASAAGTLIAALISWGAAHAGVPAIASYLTADAIARRTLLATLFLPPLVAFLTIRRELRSPLARIRREADA